MIFLYIWFGCGLFVAVVNFVQWIFDGALIGDGDAPGDRYFYLNGMLLNVVMGFLLGPVVLVIQTAMGQPILPTRNPRG